MSAEHALPALTEDHSSQIPAVMQLMNLGYTYLTPHEVTRERGGRESNVLLNNILETQLRRINKVVYKDEEYEFTGTAISGAIRTLKEVEYDGLITTNERIYDLLSLGRSFEQTIKGDKKSYTIRYIDWENPENNVFHVAEEFAVTRQGRQDTYRPDIVLFVNGIPLSVIECKRSDDEDAMDEALSQFIRNQKADGITDLFVFSQLLLAVNRAEGKYATAGTSKKYWAQWRERNEDTEGIARAVNQPLSDADFDRLFSSENFKDARNHFEAMAGAGDRAVTGQDKYIHHLCRPERLLELSRQFLVYDQGVKKIARYQQFFTVKSLMQRVKNTDDTGKRTGGVVWHTQGSGKSMVMVMLAKALILDKEILNPRIVLVTDRIDLDQQICNTFRQCGCEPIQAKTGQHLVEVMSSDKEMVITTLVQKFKAALSKRKFKNESPNIFLLVDESHRSQYGEAHTKMQMMFPNGCYIGFTGTPLFGKDKNTARKFGGLVDPTYTIDRAVEDKAVVRLLYEARHVDQNINAEPFDRWFERVTENLNAEQTAKLKKKFSQYGQLNIAEQKVHMVAWDVNDHYTKHWQGTGLKGQLVAPNKAVALKLKKFLDGFDNKVTSEVVISAPDDREGHEEIDETTEPEVQSFWKRMMDRFKNEKNYNTQIINNFKNRSHPEILIVVDKLLTGFDAPCNTVLYLYKPLRSHGLLQAIARVNRLYDGKEFGFIIDYWGVLDKLNKALSEYSALEGFDEDDLAGTMQDISDVWKELPERHQAIWDIFAEIENKLDQEAFEQLLFDEEKRDTFFERLNAFAQTWDVAVQSVEFMESTSEEDIAMYKKDFKIFQGLRRSVRIRYAKDIDYREFEPKIQKLIDMHVSSSTVQSLNDPVDIFDREAFEAQVASKGSDAAKADTIAHRVKQTIDVRMDEDPAFYKKMSSMIQEAIDAFHAQRITAAEYLAHAQEADQSLRSRTDNTDSLPASLENKADARAFYGIVREVLTQFDGGLDLKEEAAELGIAIDEAIEKHRMVNWGSNDDVKNEMRNDIEDLLLAIKAKHNLDVDFSHIDEILERTITTAKARKK